MSDVQWPEWSPSSEWNTSIYVSDPAALQGSVSDVRIANRALTVEEVEASFRESPVTPEKRNFLLKLFVICLTAAMIGLGWITADAWLPVVSLS